MDEIKPPTIPSVDPRLTSRTPAKGTSNQKQFEQLVKGEMNRMEHVRNALTMPEQPEGTSESTGLHDDLRNTNQWFREMMKSEQILSQLYHNIHLNDKG